MTRRVGLLRLLAAADEGGCAHALGRDGLSGISSSSSPITTLDCLVFRDTAVFLDAAAAAAAAAAANDDDGALDAATGALDFEDAAPPPLPLTVVLERSPPQPPSSSSSSSITYFFFITLAPFPVLLCFASISNGDSGGKSPVFLPARVSFFFFSAERASLSLLFLRSSARSNLPENEQRSV
jgi:hypothetical protein